MLDRDTGRAQGAEQLPEDPERPERVHAAGQARDDEDRQSQDQEWQRQQPDQEQRHGDPEPAVGRSPAGTDGDDGGKGDHLSASSSRMASWAPISPRPSRPRISARAGAGLVSTTSVSTNSRLPAMRLSRDLTVG